jgi:hypothetical protein
MAVARVLWHYRCMNTALFLISGIALLSVGICAIVTWVALRAAPDGYEDSNGFHATPAREAQMPALTPVVATPDAHHGAISLAA